MKEIHFLAAARQWPGIWLYNYCDSVNSDWSSPAGLKRNGMYQFGQAIWIFVSWWWMYLWGMDEELKWRFFQFKRQELLTNSSRPFPTFICEVERIEIIELVRRFCLFAPTMVPFIARNCFIYVDEQYEPHSTNIYGELYFLVYIN